MELKIEPKFESLIPALKEDELKQLEENLLKEGWRENEAIILWKGKIVDGHNRYALCLKHNIKFKTIERKFANETEVMLWIIDNQLGRRNLPDFVKLRLGWQKAELLKPIAKEHERLSGGKGCLKSDNLKVKPIDVKKEVARMAGTGHDTASKVKTILAKGDKETIAKLEAGQKDISINQAYNDIMKRKHRQEIEEKFSKQEIDQIKGTKKYSIIYADPPWKYYAGGWKNAAQHYKCMELEEIKALPIKDMEKEDCILFLWATFPALKEAIEVIEAWGFRYATCGFVWVKKTKGDKGWHFGLGNWTRANAELCLIGVKGHPQRKSASVSQIIDEPVTEHSKKPDIVRNKIVELCGNLPRIELFARQKTEGWDSWGNEVKK